MLEVKRGTKKGSRKTQRLKQVHCSICNTEMLMLKRRSDLICWDCKMKKQKLDYLVDAMSVTEAEAKMTKWLIERNERNFEIKAAITSPIIDVVE